MRTSILIFLFLAILGINQAPAQNTKSLTGVIWVLQNPEKAAFWEAIRFDDNGTFAYRRVKINSKNPSATYNGDWKKIGESQIVLDLYGEQLSFVVKLGETLTLKSQSSIYNFAEDESKSDFYAKLAAVAVEKYGKSASMKDGVPAPKIKGATYFIP